MKALKFLFIAIMAIGLAACSKDATVKPTSTKINGPLSKYFEVVDRSYKINEGKMSVEFKRIAEGGPKEADYNSEPTFTVELLDKDGNSISSTSTGIIASKEQLEAVFSLGVDETSSITFDFDNYKGAVKFKVSSKWSQGYEEVQVIEDSSSYEGGSSDGTSSLTSISDSDSDTDMESSGNQDWDALLDAYDQYVTKYISFAKKAANGDMNALTEYPSLMEQAEEYGDKLQRAQGSMSTAQWARYMKITQKMANAINEM